MTATYTDGPYCKSCETHRVIAAGGLCPICAGPQCDSYRPAPIKSRCQQHGAHAEHIDSLGRRW